MTKVIPQWVKDKEALRIVVPEELVIVGKMGVDGVKDGKLPSGEVYNRNLRRKR